MNNQRKRNRRKTAKAMTIGIRLGLLVFTAYMTVMLCIEGVKTLESRTGAPGGEIFILPLIVLLVWTGWTARKEYVAFRRAYREERRREHASNAGAIYRS